MVKGEGGRGKAEKSAPGELPGSSPAGFPHTRGLDFSRWYGSWQLWRAGGLGVASLRRFRPIRGVEDPTTCGGRS